MLSAIYPSSNNASGSSMSCFTRTRNWTASRPSTMRWWMTESQIHHRTDDDFPVANDRPLLDVVQAENTHLGRIQDWRAQH